MRRFLSVLSVISVLSVPPVRAQAPTGPLVVFNAGSLARPFNELLKEYQRRNPGVVPQQENSGSVEAARKLTELGKIPDVLGSADYQVIEQLLMPAYTTWYANFARNAMVLAYTERSKGADRIDSTNWWRILLEPGVRTGRSDPALDPNGYRTLLVLQLAERHHRQPGLAARLLAALPPRYMRPKEADLVALLQAGELDYVWSYRSIAIATGLRYVELPRAVDLSDPAFTEAYAKASVRIPGATRQGGDSLTIRGELIVYALTIPTRAPHPELARGFARFVFSPEGRAILERNGFIVMREPDVRGRSPL